MALKSIGIVYRKELKEALRDRRTLVTMLVVPLLIFPLLSVGFGAMVAVIIGKAQEEVPKIMIKGGVDSPDIVEGLKKMDNIRIIPLADDWKNQIVNKEVPLVIEIPPGFEQSLARQEQLTVTLYDYSGELKSEIARGKIQKFFDDYRDRVVTNRLAARSLPASIVSRTDSRRRSGSSRWRA